jgi:hypothetical protein
VSLSATSLTSSSANSGAGSTVTTASISPAANSLLVLSAGYAVSGATTVTGVSGAGLTWTRQVGAASVSASAKLDIWTALAGAAPGSGAITLTFGTTAVSAAWDIDSYAGCSVAQPVNTANAPKANGSGLTASLTYAAAQQPADLYHFACAAAASITMSAGETAPWTQLASVSESGPSVTLSTQVSPNASVVTGSAALSSTGSWGCAGLEIVAPVYLTNSFEYGGGNSGAVAITTGNSGGGSDSAFNIVTTGSGATTAYSETQAAHGSWSGEFVTPATDTNTIVEWSASLTGSSITTVYFRAYMWFASLSSTVRVIEVFSGASLCAAVGVQGTGNIAVFNAAGSNAGTSSGTVSAGAWFRLEGKVTASTTAGSITVSAYTSDDSTTAAFTLSESSLVLAAAITNIRFGNPTSVASATFYLDDVGASDSGYLGPASYPVTMAGAGSMAALAEIEVIAALTGSAALAALAELEAGAVLQGGATLSVPAELEAPATLAGSGALTAAALLDAIAVMTGQGTLAALAGLEAAGTLAGSASFTVPAELESGAVMTGQGSLTVLAVQEVTALLAGSGAFTALAELEAAAVLAGAGSLAVLATQEAIAAMQGESTLTVLTTAEVTAILAGAGEFQAIGEFEGFASLIGAGALIVTGTVTAGGSGVLMILFP